MQTITTWLVTCWFHRHVQDLHVVKLCWPPTPGEDQRDLKWVEAVIVLFSSGVLDTLVTLLDKFSETFLPSWGQQVSLSVANAGILCTLVSLTLKVTPFWLCPWGGGGHVFVHIICWVGGTFPDRFFSKERGEKYAWCLLHGWCMPSCGLRPLLHWSRRLARWRYDHSLQNWVCAEE